MAFRAKGAYELFEWCQLGAGVDMEAVHTPVVSSMRHHEPHGHGLYTTISADTISRCLGIGSFELTGVPKEDDVTGVSCSAEWTRSNNDRCASSVLLYCSHAALAASAWCALRRVVLVS